jgi:hypothetical protein
MLSSLGVSKLSSSENIGNVDEREYDVVVCQQNFPDFEQPHCEYVISSPQDTATARIALGASKPVPKPLNYHGFVRSMADVEKVRWTRSECCRSRVRVGSGAVDRVGLLHGAVCIGVERRFRDRGHVGN